MSYWSAPRKLAVAKAFTALQSRAVRKIPRLHRLAALQFDGADAQNGCVAAAHQQFILLAEQHSRCRVAAARQPRSEEHTSELQSHSDLHSFPTRRSSDLLLRAN